MRSKVEFSDAVIEDSHVTLKHYPSYGLKLAIEVEQHGKGSKRYKALIKAHMNNISDKADDLGVSSRYDLVFYYLPDEAVAANLKRLFHALIDDFSDDEQHAGLIKKRFKFDTYSTLAERIRTVDNGA